VSAPAPLPPEARPPDEPLGLSDETRAAWRDLFRRFITLRWVPLTAALLSLVLSVTAIIVSTRQPDVLLIMPDLVRVADGRSTGAAYVYLQPAFVTTGGNDRVEVIRGMALEVTPPAGDRATFTWSEVLRLVSDSAGGLSYEYVADAAPLVIGPRSAATPLGLFKAPNGWFFSAGTYQFKLIADRVVVAAPLTGMFSVTLSADDIAFLDQAGADKFLSFSIR
jgi:hypothetical protein